MARRGIYIEGGATRGGIPTAFAGREGVVAELI